MPYSRASICIACDRRISSHICLDLGKTVTKYLLRDLHSGNPPPAYQSPECPVGLKTPFNSPSSSKPQILGLVGPIISGPSSETTVSGINLNPVLCLALEL